MDSQKRYLLLFIVIFAIGAVAYTFLVPSFETTDFDPDVIEDISKGITTTSTTTELNDNEVPQEVNNEEVVEEPIKIVDDDTAQQLIKFTVAETSLENFTTYLIIGSDERTSNSSASRGYVDGQRADVIILGIINETNSDKYLLSIPRDLLIKNSCTNSIERINSTFSKNDCGNSAENLAANIQILTGLTVNHFASFNFEGFENIIDSFGGIEICVDETQREGFSFELQKGCQTVEGSIALNWIVSRNTEVLVGEKIVDKNGNDISEWEKMEGVSDLSRNDRQQYIILQLLDEIKNFRSLGELNSFIGTLEDAFIIDENLSINNAVNILWNFRETDLSNINKLSIPASPYKLDDGRQVLIISENFTEYAESKGLKNS
tara:strand:- start:2426 stop:3556 length:1131 start_codon:yes stop_codon:yes gene_type:complete